MIKSKNIGIREAIRELREMSLPYRMRMKYEAHQKYIRDQMAREDYVRDEGRTEGRIQATIEIYRDMAMPRDEITTKIEQKFSISQEEAEKYMDIYWAEDTYEK